MADDDANDKLVEARARLALRQESLLAALLLAEPPPAGLDPTEIEAAGASLRSKRRREVQQSWPERAKALASDFDGLLGDYVRDWPTPPGGGPVVDGLYFARLLAARGQLSPSQLRDWLAFELRFVIDAGGQRRRRRLPIVVHRFVAPQRRLIAAWIPWLGPRWIWVTM